MDSSQWALQVKSLYFQWANSASSILSNIDLSVERGQLYGLLGASGCGKTTLLRVLLGQVTPSSGTVRLFGRAVDPAHKPHPLHVGYMPQDLALYSEFTPTEMLYYFGRLHRLPRPLLAHRVESLFGLLGLEPLLGPGRLVGQMSGGQKRRVSLAIALLHHPALLMLDEPTVGVDPLLRQVIWGHLCRLSREHRVTVLLTTHYVEEARGANTVAFLRQGRLLAQGEPASLLRQYSAPSLEEVFLTLCRSPPPAEQPPSVTTEGRLAGLGQLRDWFCRSRVAPGNGSEARVESPLTCTSRGHYLCLAHLSTLVEKNFRQVYRNWSLLAFFTLLPAIEVALILLCIGRDIQHIPLAVHNAEGERADLSLLFLQSVPPSAFRLEQFARPEEAVGAVERGVASGLLHFGPNFSAALRARFFGLEEEGQWASLWNESSVLVRLDMSNQLVGLQIQRQLLHTFVEFAARLASRLGLGNDTFRPPVTFGPPVYGFASSAVVETFIAPGALVMISFFATTIVTCHLLIHEVRHCLIERALIAGATSAEFLLSHLLVQCAVLSLQLLLMLLTAFGLFSMPYLGSLPLSLALIWLQGLCGLLYGLVLSATCPDEVYATTLAIGTFFPSVIVGGVFWPVQSMPLPLQYASQCMPTTQAIHALRAILLRDWGLAHPAVSLAFLVSAAWLLLFLLSALRHFDRRIHAH